MSFVLRGLPIDWKIQLSFIRQKTIKKMSRKWHRFFCVWISKCNGTFVGYDVRERER